MIPLFDCLSALHSSVDPSDIKIHLARHTGRENPLELFFAGQFREFQEYQNKRNFRRGHILALIELQGRDRWLLGGLYRVLGCNEVSKDGWNGYKYETEELEEFRSAAGRMIVGFKRTGRQSYLLGERWASQLKVSEILPEKLSVEPFSDYMSIDLSKARLDLLVRQNLPSWRAALSSVKGVYLISDSSNGRLYVGSAIGSDGFWGRWSSYAATSHGGNKELRSALKEMGIDHARHWRWSVLETADSRTTDQEILARESHWKRVLLSREFGYNEN